MSPSTSSALGLTAKTSYRLQVVVADVSLDLIRVGIDREDLISTTLLPCELGVLDTPVTAILLWDKKFVAASLMVCMVFSFWLSNRGLTRVDSVQVLVDGAANPVFVAEKLMATGADRDETREGHPCGCVSRALVGGQSVI
jgi:hypothetical protein